PPSGRIPASGGKRGGRPGCPVRRFPFLGFLTAIERWGTGAERARIGVLIVVEASDAAMEMGRTQPRTGATRRDPARAHRSCTVRLGVSFSHSSINASQLSIAP